LRVRSRKGIRVSPLIDGVEAPPIDGVEEGCILKDLAKIPVADDTEKRAVSSSQ
jgi:hypothetical protein